MTTFPDSPRRSTHRPLLAAAAALLLGACSVLGAGGERERGAIHAPAPQLRTDPAWPQVDWQLSINPPTAARTVDTFRIVVRPTPGELQVYGGASWALAPSDMVEDAILRTLEDSGRITGVARRGVGMAPDYRLLLDLRRFEAAYGGSAMPSATIELSVKLVHAREQGIVGARTFTVAEPAATTAVASVAEAYTRALATIGHEVAGWTLETGEAHARRSAEARP